MNITISIREMNQRSSDFVALCEEIGLNPWCMNEGLATGNEEYTISVEQAKKYGLLPINERNL